MNAVKCLFPDYALSRYGNITWPGRSPELTICDLMGIFEE